MSEMAQGATFPVCLRMAALLFTTTPNSKNSQISKMEGKSNVQIKQRKVNKWQIDVSARRGESRPTNNNPPGFTTDKQTLTEVVQTHGAEADHKLVNKKSWDIALAPIKGLPMNLFIMYMSGNSISIFPIMMVGMMAFRPIQALMAIRNTMKMLEHSNQYVFMVMVYILGNIMALLLSVYKCNSMGLLPTHESDWLAFHSKIEEIEFSSGGMIH